jgi:hypothetical protein
VTAATPNRVPQKYPSRNADTITPIRRVCLAVLDVEKFLRLRFGPFR